MKKVLVLCTGNSCRSIIAEALINATFDNIIAKSCGTNPKDKVNENAKKVLVENNIWNDYYPKDINSIEEDFDLIVSVCDNAKETCPTFPKKIKNIHIPFEDPDGKDYKAFIKTYNDIKNILLPKIEAILKDI